MQSLLSCVMIASLAISFGVAMTVQRASAADNEGMVAHMVYFTLKESSPEGRKKLIAACDKYLTDHPGTVFYGAGPVAEEFDREVNLRDFDVALQLVFKNKAAHDEYQEAPRHKRFIEENRETWKTVRVFDAYLPAGAVRVGK